MKKQLKDIDNKSTTTIEKEIANKEKELSNTPVTKDLSEEEKIEYLNAEMSAKYERQMSEDQNKALAKARKDVVNDSDTEDSWSDTEIYVEPKIYEKLSTSDAWVKNKIRMLEPKHVVPVDEHSRFAERQRLRAHNQKTKGKKTLADLSVTDNEGYESSDEMNID